MIRISYLWSSHDLLINEQALFRFLWCARNRTMKKETCSTKLRETSTVWASASLISSANLSLISHYFPCCFQNDRRQRKRKRNKKGKKTMRLAGARLWSAAAVVGSVHAVSVGRGGGPLRAKSIKESTTSGGVHGLVRGQSSVNEKVSQFLWHPCAQTEPSLQVVQPQAGPLVAFVSSSHGYGVNRPSRFGAVSTWYHPFLFARRKIDVENSQNENSTFFDGKRTDGILLWWRNFDDVRILRMRTPFFDGLRTDGYSYDDATLT